MSRYFRITLLALSLGVMLSISAQQTIGDEQYVSVPKASCGEQDRTETGLQGQTTLAERFSPEPAKAYNCNLELVGQFAGEGTAGFMDVFENCVYYSTWKNPKVRHPGVTVLDVSDSGNPRATAYLSSPAMLNANQSLAIDQTRKVLFANEFNGTTFDVYDLSADCRHPALKNSMTLHRTVSHLGQFAPDGQTYYGASCCLPISSVPTDAMTPPPSGVFAIDARDLANLRGIATWIPADKTWRTHGVNLNKDGTRAYVTLYRQEGYDNPNGLAILDVSDIQSRVPNPQFRIISTLFWDDTWAPESSRPVTIRGRPYIIFTDILGAIGQKNRTSAHVCASGKPAYGFPRIIDIANEKNPSTRSKLTLEVHNPANCVKVAHDPSTSFGYGSFFCDVDDDQDAKMLACGYFEAGLRVFDIRDPARPVEIAYYKPPAPRTQSYPGSVVRNLWPEPWDQTADQVQFPMFRKHGQEIWFVSAGHGFHVVRFTNRFKAAHVNLFGK